MLRPPSACITTFTRGREPLAGLTEDRLPHPPEPWHPRSLTPTLWLLNPTETSSPCQFVYVRKEHLMIRAALRNGPARQGLGFRLP